MFSCFQTTEGVNRDGQSANTGGRIIESKTAGNQTDRSQVSMPEKRVSIAQGSNRDAPTNKGGGTKSGANVNPNSKDRTNAKRSYDARKGGKKPDESDDKVNEDDEEMCRKWLKAQIKEFKKENEMLQRKQAHKFGISFDEKASVEKDLGHMKAQNDALYQDLEARKEECEKLQAELETIAYHVNELKLIKYELLQEKRVYNAEAVELEDTEKHIARLVHDNKVLRTQLLKNKIDPNMDASKMSATAGEDNSKSSKRERNRPRESMLPNIRNKKDDSKKKSTNAQKESDEPQMWTRRKLWRYKSMEELRSLQEEATKKKGRLQRSKTHNPRLKNSIDREGKPGDLLSKSQRLGKGAWA